VLAARLIGNSNIATLSGAADWYDELVHLVPYGKMDEAILNKTFKKVGNE
jgi:hypothetical protein